MFNDQEEEGWGGGAYVCEGPVNKGPSTIEVYLHHDRRSFSS